MSFLWTELEARARGLLVRCTGSRRLMDGVKTTSCRSLPYAAKPTWTWWANERLSTTAGYQCVPPRAAAATVARIDLLRRASGGVEEVIQESPLAAPDEDPASNSPTSRTTPIERIARPEPPQERNTPGPPTGERRGRILSRCYLTCGNRLPPPPLRFRQRPRNAPPLVSTPDRLASRVRACRLPRRPPMQPPQIARPRKVTATLAPTINLQPEKPTPLRR